MIAINKHSGKLKNWSVEMPNVPYANRWISKGKILNPVKKTVLHDYIQWELENEIEYLGRKVDPDMISEDLESLLRDKGSNAVCYKDLTALLKTDFNDAIDHIVPLNLEGINDITNFQLICRECNLEKSRHTIKT